MCRTYVVSCSHFDFFSETAECILTKLDREASTQHHLNTLCFAGVSVKRWLPRPLIGWETFDLSSATIIWIKMKCDRAQIFQHRWPKKILIHQQKWPSWPLIGWHFKLLRCNCWTDYDETWQGYQHPLPSMSVSGWSLDKIWCSDLWLAEILTRLDRNQVLNLFYPICVFQADLSRKMAAVASDLLRNFQLLWNCWMDFDETWQ